MSSVSFQDQDQSSLRVCLGVIATAHGVKGLVKIRCDADAPSILNGPLYTSEKGQDTLTLTLKNSMGKYWLATVDGITDRDEALALRGTKLWLDRNKLPDLDDEDEFYIQDLVGLKAQDKNGNEIGKVIAVDNFGAGDLIEIKPLKGESYYVPFTKDNVPDLSLTEKYIVIEGEHGGA